MLRGRGTSQKKPALEAFSLTKSRRTIDDKAFLWRIPDVVVQPGEFVAVLGEHPADIKLLMGMLSGLTEPAGGVLRIGGTAAEDLSRADRARLRAEKMGFLFREPQLLPELSVLQNVKLPQKFVRTADQQAAQRGRPRDQRISSLELPALLPLGSRSPSPVQLFEQSLRFEQDGFDHHFPPLPY